MAIRKIEEIKKMVSHPLEDFFQIEKNSTEVTKFERKTELVSYPDFDTKDSEIESDYQEIYDAAMSGYDNLNQMIDTADTKFAARLGEVSVQHLNVALAAAGKKANLKQSKDNLIARQKTGSKGSTNTLVVMDRNELLRTIVEQRANKEAIDGDFTDVSQADESNPVDEYIPIEDDSDTEE